MALQSPRNNCLTCARLMEDDSLKVEEEDNTAIADVLMKHFWFTEDDLLGAPICRICWDQVKNFHQFYILVEEVYQSRMVSLIVKSEPVVEEHDSLEPNMPETSAHELSVEDPKEEHSISVQEEPAARKQVSMKDEIIGKHVDFTCRQCRAASSGFDEYIKHVMDAHGMKPAFIECCGQNFYRKNNLYYHVQILTNPGIFLCKRCNKPFDRLGNLKRHMQEQHATKEEKKFKCDRCPQSFALMSNYKSHTMQHDKIYRCTECSKKFSKGTDLLSHFASTHPGCNPLKCLPCERTFTSFKDLRSHQKKLHNGEFPYSQTNSLQPQSPTKNKDLDESNLVTTEEAALDVGYENKTDCVQSGTEGQTFQKRALRYKQHEDEIIRKHVNLSCKQCDEVSESFAKYLRHSLKAHNVELNSIECCGKLYYGKDRLSDHVQVVNNPELFRCKLCEKNFTFKMGLEVHMKRIHPTEEEQTFKCNQCLRAFGLKEQYRRHVNWHAVARKQYPCPECPCIFYRDRNLTKHVASAHPGIQNSRYQPPTVAESDRLAGGQPKSELKLQEDSEQQECSSVVKDEPASEVVDENGSECMQPSDEAKPPQLTGKRKVAKFKRKTLKRLQKEDDYIREHVKFICKWCGEDSPSFALYVNHALNVHAIKAAFIECCGKKYFRQDRIYQHVQVVNNPVTYRCEPCRKNFNNKHALTLHMENVHKFGGEFKCDWCSMTFRWQSHLARHIKIHLVRKGRKPKQRYYCTYCERTFNSIRVLQNHLKAVHTGVSP